MTKRLRLTITAGAPCLLLVLFILRDKLLGLAKYFPKCAFFSVTGYYCPACGNTRCVRSMAHGHVLLALRNNITIPFLAFLLLMLYIETAAGLAGKNVKILPRNGWVWAGVMTLFMVYYVVRNFIPEIAPI